MQNKNKNVQQDKNKLKFFLNKQNRFITFISILVITIIAKVLIHGAFFLYPSKTSAAEPLPLTAEVLILLSNQERTKSSLPSLKVNKTLTISATKKAQDMLTEDYFAHTTPNGKPFYKWIQEEGYRYKSAGENLAIAFQYPEDTVHAWMKSPSHKANILDPYYQEIGLAVAIGEFEGDDTTVVVQLFGEPIEPIIPPYSKDIHTYSPAQRKRTQVTEPIPTVQAAHVFNTPAWLIMTNDGINWVILLLGAISIILLGEQLMYRHRQHVLNPNVKIQMSN